MLKGFAMHTLRLYSSEQTEHDLLMEIIWRSNCETSFSHTTSLVYSLSLCIHTRQEEIRDFPSDLLDLFVYTAKFGFSLISPFSR